MEAILSAGPRIDIDVLCEDVLRLIIDALGWGASLHRLARVNRHLQKLTRVQCDHHRALTEGRRHVFERHGIVRHDMVGHWQTIWRRFAPDTWKCRLYTFSDRHGTVYTFSDLMEGRVCVCKTCCTVYSADLRRCLCTQRQAMSRMAKLLYGYMQDY